MYTLLMSKSMVVFRRVVFRRVGDRKMPLQIIEDQ